MKAESTKGAKRRVKQILLVACLIMEMEMCGFVLPPVIDGCTNCLKILLLPPIIMMALWVLAWVVYSRRTKPSFKGEH